jgi:hypothetical protein
MSAWRRKAIALFPELTKELKDGDTELHELFFRLTSLAAEAHGNQDTSVLRRIHGFAEWCLHEGGKLWEEAGLGFYEGLFAEVPWDQIVPWLSPFVIDEITKTWALGVGGERRRQFEQLVEARRDQLYRTHVYSTGEVEAL